MSSGYFNEEEQLEVLKRYWKEYGFVCIIAVVLAISVSFGWRYYQKQKAISARHAS